MNEILSLGVEEIGMAMIMLNREDEAGGFLFVCLGEVEEKEMKGRLVAAGNSLRSRGLARWSPTAKEMQLTSDFEALMSAFSRPRFSIRTGLVEADMEKMVTYHFGSDSIVEHKTEDGLVHEIRTVKSEEEVDRLCSEYLDFNNALAFDCQEKQVPLEILEEAKGMAELDPEALPQYLKDAGAGDEDAVMLTEDILGTQFRGYMTRIDYTEEVVSSNRGFLTMKGPERAWIFKIIEGDNQTNVIIMSGTSENFSHEYSELTKV